MLLLPLPPSLPLPLPQAPDPVQAPPPASCHCMLPAAAAHRAAAAALAHTALRPASPPPPPAPPPPPPLPSLRLPAEGLELPPPLLVLAPQGRYLSLPSQQGLPRPATWREGAGQEGDRRACVGGRPEVQALGRPEGRQAGKAAPAGRPTEGHSPIQGVQAVAGLQEGKSRVAALLHAQQHLDLHKQQRGQRPGVDVQCWGLHAQAVASGSAAQHPGLRG